jgi:hypothetical protein
VLEARAVLDAPGLAALGVVLPDWLMGGQGVADLRLDLPDGRPGTLRVESDLDGLSLDPRAWLALGQEATGALEAEVLLGPTPVVPVLNLRRAGSADDRARDACPGGGLARLTVERLRVGTWLDVAGALVGRGAGRLRRRSRSTADACR